MTEKNMTEIAMRIRERRLTLALSYQELADLTGMSKSSLQRYESGAIKNLPLRRIKSLAQALDTTPEWLLGLKPRAALDEALEGVDFALFGEVRDLTDEQKRDVLRFVQFVKQQPGQ